MDSESAPPQSAAVPPTAGSRAVGILKKLAPYAVAGAALFWVMRGLRFDDLKAAFLDAPLALFVFVSAVMLVLNCAADVFAMRTVFHWFGVDVPFKDLYIVRAATYLLAVINYHVGQAAIVGYLYRARKVPLFRATGWILFIIGVNVGTLFLLASAGAMQAPRELHWMRYLPLLTIAGAALYTLLLWIKPTSLASRSLLSPLFEMGIRGHIKGVLVRLPHVGVLILWHWLSLRMFHINVPAIAALMYLPAYFAVGSLPVNVSGLGMAQVVAVTFFSPYVQHGEPHATVTAYSLATTSVALVLQLLMGMLALGRASRLGVETRAALDAAETPAAPSDGPALSLAANVD